MAAERTGRALATLVIVLLAAFADDTALSVRTPRAGGPRIVRRFSPARKSVCDHPRRTPYTYHYPIRPFRRQHPIRGNFGDPRTLTSESFGADSPRSPGSFNFHNGVDISAPAGTRVYPVVSGVAQVGYADEVIVDTPDFRVFQYFHIRPVIRPHQHVIAYRTVLGHVLPRFLHVHLTEIDDGRAHNPADPGHLEPYHDHTVPVVHGLRFTAADGAELNPEHLHGRVEIAANANDTPPIPIPGETSAFPVTPALVAWRMTSESGEVVVARTVVADFRHGEPPNRNFWRVYAAGTYQNFPVFSHRLFPIPGRYLFKLTPSPLETARLADGVYVVTVEVADVCGNRGSLSERVRIRGGAITVASAAEAAGRKRLVREGCQNQIHSGCGSVVLMYEAADAVTALDGAAGA